MRKSWKMSLGGFMILLPWLAGSMPWAQEKSYATITIEGKKLSVEVARTEAQKTRGLMYRERLGKDEGMLFVYEQEEVLSFWMKNTRLPLSIAFIDRSGTIVDIQDMQPFSLEVHVSPIPVRYALEVNQGWFRKQGIGIGHRVSFPPEFRK